MKRKTGILGVLIAILLLGIGYAAITAVPLIINGQGTISPAQANFNVVYTNVTTADVTTGLTVTPEAIPTDGTTTTGFTITGMTKKGDTATLTYTITNKSADLKADLSEATTYITNSNPDYFDVTPATFATTQLAANGGNTTQTVTVTVKKTPVGDADVTGTFKLELSAAPNNN